MRVWWIGLLGCVCLDGTAWGALAVSGDVREAAASRLRETAPERDSIWVLPEARTPTSKELRLLDLQAGNTSSGGVVEGRSVRSYLLDYESIQGLSLTGTITFDRPIIGFLLTDPGPDTTQESAGAGAFSFSGARALPRQVTNGWELDADVRTLRISAGPEGVDPMRVFVSHSVPEGSSGLMWLGLLLGGAAVGFRRRFSALTL